ncbi:MAG TPA: WecB/TagA/CpsF family glycosyltransferase [Thermodesulfobacteriota bacterium]|nr:WecB/TagA/CpsF family glycosyltransferase [Thermodesulfobacteriota bacterium]HNU71225.1 WecB/TagA/CpsF family glycosyltransferase [Thermodesulfobacteriota bacterium]HOC39289.1 WecB/TagA/CpsF family glycosyltransferase [Thermodesulfobacteriota bacterium]HQO76930.1 WecB/TagA/CpsF family glycosyltransferase [Thermodesulfobacteriota bacterium]
MKPITYKGIKIDDTNYDDVRRKILRAKDQKHYISLVDAMTLVNATADPELFRALNHAYLTISDGTPVAWYGKVLGARRLRRLSGGRLMQQLLEEDNGLSHFLFGDTTERIEAVIKKVSSVKPAIRINGFAPPFREQFSEGDNQAIFDRINKHNPDLVWVSLGGGKQDKWMYANYHRLNHGILIGVGAAFKYYIGELITPPAALQTLGLQCIYRILQERKNHSDQWSYMYRSIRIRGHFFLHALGQIYSSWKSNASR